MVGETRVLMLSVSQLLIGCDLAGTLVFAIEGAIGAIPAQLDVFGIMVIAFTSALAGGIMRDVLIGAVPPMAIRDPRYAVTAFVGGAIVFLLTPLVREVPSWVVIGLDAAGLSLFAMSGSLKALEYKINPVLAALLGTTTGVGGGVVAAVLLARVPPVLMVQVYAVAALIGSAVMILGVMRGQPRTLMVLLGGSVCFLIRVVSAWQQWNLPRISPNG